MIPHVPDACQGAILLEAILLEKAMGGGYNNVLMQGVIEARAGGGMMPEDAYSQLICNGDLLLDTVSREMWRGRGDWVHLTRRECRLLEVLMAHPGKVLNHEVLMREVWDTGYLDDIRIVYAYIHRVRRRMHDVGGGRIETVRGVGYRFRSCE